MVIIATTTERLRSSPANGRRWPVLPTNVARVGMRCGTQHYSWGNSRTPFERSRHRRGRTSPASLLLHLARARTGAPRKPGRSMPGNPGRCIRGMMHPGIDAVCHQRMISWNAGGVCATTKTGATRFSVSAIAPNRTFGVRTMPVISSSFWSWPWPAQRLSQFLGLSQFFGNPDEKATPLPILRSEDADA